jgi:HSP20 family protein
MATETKTKGYAVRPAGKPLYQEGLMRRFAEDVDRVFQDFGFGGLTRFDRDLWNFWMAPKVEFPLWTPEIEAFRRGDKLVVRADLPGMEKDNVKVEIEENKLMISGERKEELKEETDELYRSERSYGRFYRAFPLPEGIKPEQINATFKNGVLEVILPIPQEPKPERKPIEIK